MWNNYDPLIAKIQAVKIAASNAGRKPGHIHGMRRKTYERKLLGAKREANRIVRYMTDKKQFVADNDVSEEAFKEVLVILRAPGPAKDRLAAAKTLLEYTQKKPVAATEMTLNNAESFLDAVLADEKKERDEARASRSAEKAEGEL